MTDDFVRIYISIFRPWETSHGIETTTLPFTNTCVILMTPEWYCWCSLFSYIGFDISFMFVCILTVCSLVSISALHCIHAHSSVDKQNLVPRHSVVHFSSDLKTASSVRTQRSLCVIHSSEWGLNQLR